MHKIFFFHPHLYTLFRFLNIVSLKNERISIRITFHNNLGRLYCPHLNTCLLLNKQYLIQINNLNLRDKKTSAKHLFLQKNLNGEFIATSIAFKWIDRFVLLLAFELFEH